MTKGFVYRLNKITKELVFTAEFESVEDSSIYVHLMNEQLERISKNSKVVYVHTSKKDDFSLLEGLIWFFFSSKHNLNTL